MMQCSRGAFIPLLGQSPVPTCSPVQHSVPQGDPSQLCWSGTRFANSDAKGCMGGRQLAS